MTIICDPTSTCAYELLEIFEGTSSRGSQNLHNIGSFFFFFRTTGVGSLSYFLVVDQVIVNKNKRKVIMSELFNNKVLLANNCKSARTNWVREYKLSRFKGLGDF